MPSVPEKPVALPAWDDQALDDPHAQRDKAERVEKMFDAIAPTYERVNRVLTFGRDAAWRRRAIAAAELRAGDVALDVCCGTGDMVRLLAGHQPAPKLVIGLDFSAQMLAAGSYPTIGAPIQLARADGLRLPLRDGSVDVVTCAFGVRNFSDLDAGLREFRRVLRPGGRCVILEFAATENALVRVGYRFYTNVLLPRLGAALSGDHGNAYRYLPKSIESFARRGELSARLRTAGFADVTTRGLNFGSVVVYRAV